MSRVDTSQPSFVFPGQFTPFPGRSGIGLGPLEEGSDRNVAVADLLAWELDPGFSRSVYGVIMLFKRQDLEEKRLEPNTVRATLYLDPSLHQALRLKAASSRRSMSDIVNEALRVALRDDEEDLAAVAVRSGEPTLTYEREVYRKRWPIEPWIDAPRICAQGEYRLRIHVK